MRACFLGQNVCALGFGVATLQTSKLEDLSGTPYRGTIGEDGQTSREEGRDKSFLPIAGGPLPASARALSQ